MKLGKTVSSRMLQESIHFDNARQLRDYLTGLGYKKYKTKVNVGGVYHNVWYKDLYEKTVVKTFRESLA